MFEKKFYVKSLLKYKGRTVGAELLDVRTNETLHISRDKFSILTERLTNAKVLNNGVIRGTNGQLFIKEITNEEMLELTRVAKSKREIRQNEIRRYIIMWEDIEVLKFNKETDEFEICNEHLLPFGLRNVKKLRGSKILKWIADRVTNINRTYMNLIYIARQVGRDVDKVIADSAGLSIIDHFWIKTTDTSHLKWINLQELLDKNAELNRIAVEGILKGGKNLRKKFTSLFTLKGYYPKYACDGYLYKTKADAIKEYPAYLLAKQLKLPIAKCSIEGKLVKIELFTNANASLVHAREIGEYFDYSPALLTDVFALIGREDLKMQIDQLYIFNYLIGNIDLHSENFGFLFDNKTFDIISVAPFFDHNMSFDLGFSGETGNLGINIEQWAKNTVKLYPQLYNLLQSLNLTVVQPFISKKEYAELVERYENLLEWSRN